MAPLYFLTVRMFQANIGHPEQILLSSLLFRTLVSVFYSLFVFGGGTGGCAPVCFMFFGSNCIRH